MVTYKTMLLKRFIKLTSVIVFLWLMGFSVFLFSIPAKPSKNYLETEAFIIFTGGTNRVSTGIEEFTKSKADKILISGVGINVSKADIVSRLPEIHENLNNDEKIVLGRIANSTFSNATETAIFVQLNKVKSITVVTSNYHMPRSRILLANKIPDTQVEYLPIVTKEKGQFFRKIGLLLSEYHKSVVSLVIIGSDIIDEYYWETLKSIRDRISPQTPPTPEQ